MGCDPRYNVRVEATEELRNGLFLAQYGSAREVVLHARQVQHSIVSWSTASAGVLIGAGAVIANDGARAVTAGTSGMAFLLLFGVALPGLVAGSFNSWIGEVARMRRAASFLRDLEFSIYVALGPGTPTTPIYDTVVSRGPRGRGESATRVGRSAVASVYLGLLGLSLAVASAALWNFDVPHGHSMLLRVVAQILLAGELVWFGWAVHDGFKTVAPYGGHDPTLIDNALLVHYFGERD